MSLVKRKIGKVRYSDLKSGIPDFFNFGIIGFKFDLNSNGIYVVES